MPEYKVRRSLPMAHNREIGRIVTHWSHLEWRLKNVVYVLLGIGPKEGRLAVREIRASSYATMIEDLLDVKCVSVSIDLGNFRKLLSELGDHRNRLVHGVWLKHPSYSDPVLQLTKGESTPDPTNPAGKRKRVIDPEGILVKADELRKFVPLIDRAAATAGRLELEVRRAFTSRAKPVLRWRRRPRSRI